MNEDIDKIIAYYKAKPRRYYLARRNWKEDRLLIRWLKSCKRSYGRTMNPFAWAVIKRFKETAGKEKQANEACY